MKLFITTPPESSELLNNSHFQADWDRLYALCPWSTPFQGRAFVATWYTVYQKQYQPVIVRQYATDGTLVGVLTLAFSSNFSQLVVAGAHQAEYHAWLALPELGTSFIQEALHLIHEQFPRQILRFVYLPPSIPVDWIKQESSVGQRCVFEPHKRPLMHIGDGSQITASLRKKSNKSRLNRLNRYGKLRFEQISERTDLESIFDQIAICYDFRQAAVHQSHPFEDDPLKKAFHLALMERPDLVHMTVLYVGSTLAAANFGLADLDEINLGVFVQNPFFAKHSPGKFHVFMLGQKLSEQGISTLDLTPGGDPWKERFATDHDEVALLTIYPTHASAWWYKAQQQAISLAKQSLERIHMTPQTIKTMITWLHPKKSLQGLKALWQRSEVCLYRIASEAFDLGETSRPMTKDSLEDLLAFRPQPGERQRDDMLAHWLRRIEAGAHVYSYVEESRLVHCGWILKQAKTIFFPEVGQEAAFPPETVLLFDFYTQHQDRESTYYQMSLPQMLHDAETKTWFYIAAPAENRGLRQIIEGLGFIYDYSLFSETRFGKRRQWTNRPNSESQKQEPLQI